MTVFTALCDWLRAISEWMYRNLWLTVKQYGTDFQQHLTFCTVFFNIIYSILWLAVHQFVNDSTAICDWLKQVVTNLQEIVTVSTAICASQQLVNKSTAICNGLYSNMRQNFSNMTEYTAIYDSLYIIFWLSVQPYVTDIEHYVTHCTDIYYWVYRKVCMNLQHYVTVCTEILWPTV